MNDKNLRETLKRACLVSMPTEAAKHAVAFIDGTEHDRMGVPSIATLSRVRARLDTAWMLYFREHVLMPKLMVSDGSGVRVFVQTDAAWQARQEYQVTILNVVACADLLPLHKDCWAHGSWGIMVLEFRCLLSLLQSLSSALFHCRSHVGLGMGCMGHFSTNHQAKHSAG